MSTTISRTTDATTVVPDLVLNDWESDTEPQTIAHPILGSSDVAVTLRPARLITGRMRMLFSTAATAETARAFHTAAAVFHTTSDLSWVPASYVPLPTITLTQQPGNRRWVLVVPFQEVSP
jgi:hypothetical protein